MHPFTPHDLIRMTRHKIQQVGNAIRSLEYMERRLGENEHTIALKKSWVGDRSTLLDTIKECERVIYEDDARRNKLPKVSIVTSGEVIHYAAPEDNIINRLTYCGINKNVSGAPTTEQVTCRTCKKLVDHVIDQ